jgi:hypothetical protein
MARNGGTWARDGAASATLLALAGCASFAAPPARGQSPPPPVDVPACPPQAVSADAAGPGEPSPGLDADRPWVWGLAGLRGFAIGDQPAPNGNEFQALFSLDMNFNLWLWPQERLYLFTDTRFWGQRAAPGVTNASQGVFDFSKREFDLDLGLAWNYFGAFEARAFAYSFNNLNRGSSLVRPTGYADGVGLENRWYVGGSYAELGTREFDVTRATFLSIGFYPSKDMPDGNGDPFRPGPFVRAYLTWDLYGERCYLYADLQGVGTPRMLSVDSGVAARPWAWLPRLELRLGSAETYDLRLHEMETDLYGAVRFAF